jgi:FixJ family two-component response regulator
MTHKGNVFVVDDDARVRKALQRLLTIDGFNVIPFEDAESFLAGVGCDMPGCVVLDFSMPALDGIMLQRELLARGCRRAIVFVTGHGDVAAGVQAMKAGAVDFLEKPVVADQLLEAVTRGLEQDRQWRDESAYRNAVAGRVSSLTRREREVLELVVKGQLNKQIAAALGTVEKTIKVHRARMMEKMGVRSVAMLVHLTERIGLQGLKKGDPRAAGHFDTGPAPTPKNFTFQ